MMKIAIFMLFLLYSIHGFAQTSKAQVPFTFKEFHNLTNFFETKQDLIDFFEFEKGQIVADIGAGNGIYEGAFSLLTDSITFYSEDIDDKNLTQAKLNKIIKHYGRLKKSAITNTFHICIGSVKATNLPETTFDKIIIIQALHEFSFMDEMIDDISKKLKPDGKLYILDARCIQKGHVSYNAEEIITRMEKHGFHLKKIDQTNRNGSEDLYKAVFSK